VAILAIARGHSMPDSIVLVSQFRPPLVRHLVSKPVFVTSPDWMV
jgi:hypothetical protein